MKSAIHGAFPTPGAKLWLKEMELDLGARSLRRGSEVVPLRPKTFDLLVYLVDHRNRIVTKEELLTELWPDAAVTMDAVVQSVLDLRRSLGDSARNPQFIKTVSKVGYQFIAKVSDSEPVVRDEGTASQAGLAKPPRRRRIVIATLVALGGIAGVALSLSRVESWRQAAEPERFEVAWWKLNEGSGAKINDSIHGLNAALPAGVSWTSGIAGHGLMFTGREMVVRGFDPGALPKGDAPRTLTAWIKTPTTNADSTIAFMVGDPQPDSASTLTLGLHESGTAVFATGHHFEVVGKRRIDDDRWHQITGVFEGRESRRMRLFVDGGEEAEATLAALSPNRESQWAIGRAFSDGTSFHGAIDDIRVFARALRPDEIRSLYRCLATAGDIDMRDRGTYQFVTLFGDRVEVLPRRPGENSAAVRNTGNDFAGVTIARREPDCGLRTIHGADVGQDLNIEAQLLVPIGSGGAVTDAGPFFRSRRANPGDGIVGGTSAGFWVHLDSTGQVRVQRLHPNAILAFSDTPEGFDPKVFHRLEAAVDGETLEVALDSRVVTFEAGGVRTTRVPSSPAWESASPKGTNGGSAGIAFSSSRNRGQAGGQEARDIRVTPYHSLASLPVTTIQSR
ncbi:MAG TPA: LamG-like jellyroll fold domain-containing protein [Bryobacteraceae bacterium]|nr:LamG-like jellyroll fold domain-containing protein [Bryobacteraceae bacterium]